MRAPLTSYALRAHLRRGVTNYKITLGGVELPQKAWLKLIRLENHVAQPLEEFALCDVPGKGALYQVTIAAEGLEGQW